MPYNELENLASIGHLREEAFDQTEFNGLLDSASDKLIDVGKSALSLSSRCSLTYAAAHALALAALRFHGFRCNKRYLVFQCLVHTTPLRAGEMRVFGQCHDKRNLAEYEGHLDVDERLMIEFFKLTEKLFAEVRSLT